jgi:acetyl-CoA carboxylase carboxyltransferase component
VIDRKDEGTTGFVAQPLEMAGVWMIHPTRLRGSSVLRCIQHSSNNVCDLPLPAGCRPGTCRVIRHGAKVLYACSEATVPKLTVI